MFDCILNDMTMFKMCSRGSNKDNAGRGLNTDLEHSPAVAVAQSFYKIFKNTLLAPLCSFILAHTKAILHWKRGGDETLSVYVTGFKFFFLLEYFIILHFIIIIIYTRYYNYLFISFYRNYFRLNPLGV